MANNSPHPKNEPYEKGSNGLSLNPNHIPGIGYSSDQSS